MKIAAAVLVLACPLAAQPAENLRGYPPAASATERQLESSALKLTSAAHIGEYMHHLAAVPHHAGSPASHQNAEYILNLLRGWGLNAHIEQYESLLPYPKSRHLEMTAPVTFTASLHEPAIPQDPYSGQPNQLPTYNAYAADGDVTGQVVYVNYGIPDDYAELDKRGISVKGKIALARYGKSWRGTKAKVAAEHGALACLIYSDPHEDGYFIADPYPKGPTRPAEGVQRGSVVDMPLYPGDPLSPGWASEKGSRRLTRAEAKSLMRIPVQPISYADATPLLSHLEGPIAPENWRGALPFTYHIGPGPTAVHLSVSYDWSTRPVYDVIATIPGREFPDEWVVWGNHHDAWVNGAHDPTSAAAPLLETARALSGLLKQGWRPRRTIVLAFWDAEEFGLIGSTEYAEKHAAELNRKAVAYFNSDTNARGALGAGGSATLELFLTQVLSDLRDPDSGKSVLEVAREHHAEERRREKRTSSAVHDDGQFHLQPLGAGSDYVAFTDYVGVASINLGFEGQNLGGVYHSIYDSLTWFERFADPGFRYGQALAGVMSSTLLRLADAPLLPFEFTRFSSAIKRYVEDLRPAGGNNVDLTPITEAVAGIDKAAEAYDAKAAAALPTATPAALERVNQALFHSERALLLERGLPRREWYRNQISAPGTYTGYSAKSLPGVREAIENKNWSEAGAEVGNVVKVLNEMQRRIEAATAAF